MLADLTGTIEDAVVDAGYAGLAVVMAVETVFPPIPSEIVLPFAGFQVAKGTLGFVPALLASTLGAVLGALGDGAELVTVITGAGAPLDGDRIEALAPDGVELELSDGGQPGWWWLLSAE